LPDVNTSNPLRVGMLCMMCTEAQLSSTVCAGMVYLPFRLPVSVEKKYISRFAGGSDISQADCTPPPGSWLQDRILPSQENALVCPIVEVLGTFRW
jgi:hypothetical protein